MLASFFFTPKHIFWYSLDGRTQTRTKLLHETQTKAPVFCTSWWLISATRAENKPSNQGMRQSLSLSNDLLFNACGFQTDGNEDFGRKNQQPQIISNLRRTTSFLFKFGQWSPEIGKLEDNGGVISASLIARSLIAPSRAKGLGRYPDDDGPFYPNFVFTLRKWPA